jgi:hypothetical protein
VADVILIVSAITAVLVVLLDAGHGPLTLVLMWALIGIAWLAYDAGKR